MGLKIGFIGAGSMAESMIAGWRAAKVDVTIWVSNRGSLGRLQDLASRYHVHPGTIGEALHAADVIILAMKPQDLPSFLRAHQEEMSLGKPVVSIAAGITLAEIRKYVLETTYVVRIMPNTPVQLGYGLLGICASANVPDLWLDQFTDLLKPLGHVEFLKEDEMDLFTAIAGSGPAFWYAQLEAAIAGAMQLGLTKERAVLLVGQTLLGAAHMVHQSGEEPAVLRAKVTSKGGTTASGLVALQEADMPAVWAKTYQLAARRSKELGQKIDTPDSPNV